MNKKQTAVRLTKEAKEILEKYSKKLGVTKTSIFEMALRVYDKLEGEKDGQK
jgi:predicted DNA-binding protein